MGQNFLHTELQRILSEGWVYRGEGNANLVLALPKTRTILRIRKSERPDTVMGWLFDWIVQIFLRDGQSGSDSEAKQLLFYNCLMVPALGSAYVHPATSIVTYRGEIQKLDKELMPVRPAHRKHKQLQHGTATLFADYAFLPKHRETPALTCPTLAVEIKPKQGWIPVPDRHFGKCQFCLNQHLKLENGEINQLSCYCPLDLFSGCKNRMKKALRSLIRNPQNNFRVFKDGIYWYGETKPVEAFYDLLRMYFEEQNSIISLMEDFLDLIIQSLLKNFGASDGCDNCDSNINAITYSTEISQNGCLFNATELPVGCLLEKILRLQKFNSLGIDGYKQTYESLIKENISFDEWGYVDLLLEEICNSKVMCLKCLIKKCGEKCTERKEPAKVADLVPYLVAAVANDCSFMVTFRKLTEKADVPPDFVMRVRNCRFVINLGIFDLYPKPASTIMKHWKRNSKIQNGFLAQNT